MSNKQNLNTRKSFLSGGFGVVVAIFFVVAAIYFSWLYAVPAILNFKISNEKINNFVETKFNYNLDYYSSSFYTTPSAGIGVRLKDVKLTYPNSKVSTDEGIFLRAKSAVVEVAFIPLLMKTVKFNQFLLRGVNIDTFQNAAGEYAYQEHIKANFNPNMPKYVLQVPEIKLLSYCLVNYNQQTDTFKKECEMSKVISPYISKSLLEKSPNSKNIILK